VDFVVNHNDGGHLYINNGSTWVAVDGEKVPAVPLGHVGNATTELRPNEGAAYLDLNGDGVTDVLWTGPNNQGQIVSHAWLNKFKPPVITSFANGFSKPSTVSYVGRRCGWWRR
jgi:hypothetical protein